jgi:Ser/Thr protein kinase RdoA (MazF antagonist)
VDPSEGALAAAWAGLGDPRRITEVEETSAHVSTNRVFRLTLDDAAHVVAKVSSFGSYFLFAEDHDRLARLSARLQGGRWAGFLADVVTKDGRPYLWYDGRRWAALYVDVERGGQLPRRLSDAHVATLAREVAAFHLECARIAPHLPPTSGSMKGDLIHLLELLRAADAPLRFGLPAADVARLDGHTHSLLLELERRHYDEWPRIPILVDWNLGNFSVRHEGDDFRLHTRWDYDWFRVESRLLDFYFLSRVSSATGDRTRFAYSPHTLVESRFAAFLRAYHAEAPLARHELDFLPLAFKFFVLNYVVREGAKFFRPDLCEAFRRDAVRHLDTADALDLGPLFGAVGVAGEA